MEKQNTPAFSKSQILKAKKYRPYVDVLAVVLSEGKMYTAEEIQSLLSDFLKQPVKEETN